LALGSQRKSKFRGFQILSSMLFPSVFYLQIFVQFSFCSLDTQQIPFILSDHPVKANFIKEIEQVDFSLPANPLRDQYNPIFFGKETLISVFEKVKYLVKDHYSLLSSSQRFDFNDSVDKNFYSFLKKYYNLKPKEFLSLAINYNFSFQWFILFVGFSEEAETSLTSFVNFIYLAESLLKGIDEFTPKYSKERMDSFFLAVATLWTNQKLKPLFESIKSVKEWEDRKEIIKLHLDLLTHACLRLFSILDLRLEDPEFSEQYLYSFLYNNFKVNANGEIDIEDYQKVFEKLEDFARNPLESLKPKVPFYTKIEDRYLALFLLYSEYFINIPSSQEKLSSLRIKLICHSFVLKGETEFTECLYIFEMQLENLIAFALRTIKSEIRKHLNKDFPFCDQVIEYFQGQNIPFLSELTKNILRNYAEGRTPFTETKDWGVSRWKIKIYLHLFHYYETVIAKKLKTINQ
jgi:hypothetical protein